MRPLFKNWEPGGDPHIQGERLREAIWRKHCSSTEQGLLPAFTCRVGAEGGIRLVNLAVWGLAAGPDSFLFLGASAKPVGTQRLGVESATVWIAFSHLISVSVT